MELRLLRTFVAVAELRHFAKAAAQCHLSQPAVSHQIALLEREVGARLLNRGTRHVSLTVAGEVLLEEARRVIGAVDRAHERLQAVVRGAVGRVRLGASPTPGLYLLPALLHAYRRAHPEYEVRFEIGRAHDLGERVARNDIDMAVVAGAPPTGELQVRPLGRDALVIVAAASRAPNRRRGSVTPRQLEGETWLLREHGSATRRELTAWWQRHHLAPQQSMTLDGPDAVKRAVMAGLGIAMVARATVDEEVAAGRLTELRLAAEPLPVLTYMLVDHPQKHHGAACRAMVQMLEEGLPGR